MPFKSLGLVSYSPSIVTIAVSVAVCEIFSVKELCDQPVSVALSIASRYALPGYSDRRVRVRGPGWPDHCVRL